MSKMLENFGKDIVYSGEGPWAAFSNVYKIKQDEEDYFLRVSGSEKGIQHLVNEVRNFKMAKEISGVVPMIGGPSYDPMIGYGFVKKVYSGSSVVDEKLVDEKFNFLVGYNPENGSIRRSLPSLSVVGYELTGKAQSGLWEMKNNLHSQRLGGFGFKIPGNIVSSGPDNFEMTDLGWAIYIPKSFWRWTSDAEFDKIKEKDNRDLDDLLSGNLR